MKKIFITILIFIITQNLSASEFEIKNKAYHLIKFHIENANKVRDRFDDLYEYAKKKCYTKQPLLMTLEDENENWECQKSIYIANGISKMEFKKFTTANSYLVDFAGLIEKYWVNGHKHQRVRKEFTQCVLKQEGHNVKIDFSEMKKNAELKYKHLSKKDYKLMMDDYLWFFQNNFKKMFGKECK